MRRFSTLAAVLVALSAGAALAQGQVATVEFKGVDTTLPHSRGVTGWQADGSVGEATILVLALDASGKPVAGAPVEWTVTNATDAVAYVVQGDGVQDLARAYKTRPATILGGTTGADGTARLVLDSLTVGDAKVAAVVGGVEGKTYDGGGAMRVVWF